MDRTCLNCSATDGLRAVSLIILGTHEPQRSFVLLCQQCMIGRGYYCADHLLPHRLVTYERDAPETPADLDRLRHFCTTCCLSEALAVPEERVVGILRAIILTGLDGFFGSALNQAALWDTPALLSDPMKILHHLCVLARLRAETLDEVAAKLGARRLKREVRWPKDPSELCRSCHKSENIRQVLVLDPQSGPGWQTRSYCVRCLKHKGHGLERMSWWCARHDTPKTVFVDRTTPLHFLELDARSAAELPSYTVRLSCPTCCQAKLRRLLQTEVEGLARIVREKRPELVEVLERQATAAGLKPGWSPERRLSFGLLQAAAFYDISVSEVALMLSTHDPPKSSLSLF